MKYLFTAYFLLCSTVGVCQFPTNDLQISSNKKEWFDQHSTIANNELSVGEGEQIQVLSHTTSPFISNGKWLNGNISYRYNEYYNVPLMFDLYQNELITQNELTYYPIKLYKNQVIWFELEEITYERHTIKRIDGSADMYLEVIFKGGSIDFFLLPQKVLKVKGGVNTYTYRKELWVRNKSSNEFILIKNRGTLKKIFPNDKKQINSFFRKEKLPPLRKCTTNQLNQIAEYFNQL